MTEVRESRDPHPVLTTWSSFRAQFPSEKGQNTCKKFPIYKLSAGSHQEGVPVVSERHSREWAGPCLSFPAGNQGWRFKILFILTLFEADT